jgi:hypothetical protein
MRDRTKRSPLPTPMATAFMETGWALGNHLAIPDTLQALKQKYEPDNFFRLNQNIPPS